MIIRPYEAKDAVALAELFVQAVEQIGSRDYSPAQLKSWAGPCPTAARRFFAKKGFVVTGRRDFEVSGVAIHNYAVEKILSDASVT